MNENKTDPIGLLIYNTLKNEKHLPGRRFVLICCDGIRSDEKQNNRHLKKHSYINNGIQNALR